MPSESTSKPPTPPAAFRSALLFPEDANLKAYATPDSPSENPLNQPKRGSPQPPPLALDDAAEEQVDDATAVSPDVESPHPLLPDERPYTAGYKAGYAEGFAAGHAAGLRAAAASTTASTSGWRVLTQPSDDNGGAPPPPPGAYVFHCSSETEAECLDRRLLGCSYAARAKVEGITKGTPLVLYNIKSRRAVGPFTATGPPQRNIAKGAFGGRFDLHVAFFDGPYELLFDASVDSKSGRGPDIGRWTTWESATATKRRRSAPRKASP
jgi:hypothetical protein